MNPGNQDKSCRRSLNRLSILTKRTGKLVLVSLGILLFSVSTKAQTEAFEPNGKSIIRIFSNYHTTLSGGETVNAFELKRVYLGYQHNFSEYLSGSAVLDVGDPGVGKLQMTAFVKNAFLRYRKDKLTVNFGMISTTQFKVQESAWGYRYLEKSFQDQFKFNSSADIGLSAAYRFSDFISADLIIQNGEGYKKIEADSALRAGAGVSITPFDGFTARAYYDYSNKVNAQQSIATFLGYEAERFSIGAEWMKMYNYKFAAYNELNGLSFFGTFITSEKTRIFARYDKLYSNTVAGDSENWNLENDGQQYIVGFEYSPVRGIKLTPNFKGWKPADNSDFVSTFILNCEVRF